MIRPHIRTYAENTFGYVAETFHAERWLHEVDSNLAGPMVRAPDGQDYYVFEPALAFLTGANEATPVFPTRWIEQDGEYWAKAHVLQSTSTRDAFIIDGSSCINIPLTAFTISMRRLEGSYKHHNLPPPNKIAGMLTLFLLCYRPL